MTYSPEPIPTSLVKSMIDSNWDTQSGNIPEPTLVDLNDGTGSSTIRLDLAKSDYVIINLGNPGENETYRDGWHYLDRINYVELRIHTKHSRQRLYNLKQEIRRIVHSKVHDINNYHIVRYRDFNELTQEEFGIWVGKISLSLENNRISMEI